LFSSPCLAQIEPEGIFWVENTLWQLEGNYSVQQIGFYAEKVYVPYATICYRINSSSSYSDFILVSIFEVTYITSLGVGRMKGFLLPLLRIGFGVDFSSYTSSSTQIMLQKVSDSWYPSNCTDM
jgi:hypothetical protein